MTNLQKEQVKNAIDPYCKMKDMGITKLAEKIGISASTLYSIRNGNYASVDDKIFKRVWHVINPETLEGIFQTSDFKAVYTALDVAVKHCRMIAITGDTGMGKTTALKSYALRPNVFYVYIDATVTPNIFLTELLKEMGCTCYGSPSDLLKRVVCELNTLESPLLIVDEAGKIKDKLVLLLHSLRDQTKGNAGIVLGGMPHFKKMMVDKMTKGVNGYSEFFRRINVWHELHGLSRDEIVYILEQNGITDREEQKEFRTLNRFGDLDNAIQLHKTLNN